MVQHSAFASEHMATHMLYSMCCAVCSVGPVHCAEDCTDATLESLDTVKYKGEPQLFDSVCSDTTPCGYGGRSVYSRSACCPGSASHTDEVTARVWLAASTLGSVLSKVTSYDPFAPKSSWYRF